MAKLAIKKASTDVTVYLFIQDSSKTTGEGLAGLAYNTGSLVGYYVRPKGSATAITLATQTVTGNHSDGGFVEIDATNMPGVYRLDLPDAVCATGVPSVVVMLKGATNMSPVVLEIQLTDFDLNTAAITAAGIADAVWDEATADHTTATSFGSLDANVDAILADTGTDGVVLANDAITAAKYDESTAFPIKSADAGSTLIARVGADSYDLTDIFETLTSDGVVVKAILTNVITQYAVDAAAVTKIQSGLALEATLTAIKGAGWTNQTLVKIVTDIAAISAGSGATAQEVWEYATRVLTAGTNIDLSALATASALATTDGKVDSILEDTGTTLDTLIKDIPTNTELATALGTADDAVLAAVAAAKSVIDNIHDTDLPAVKAETALIIEDTGTTIPATLGTLATTAHVQEVEDKVDTADAVADAIKARTDQLTFTVANKVDATATTDTSNIAGDVWSYAKRTLTHPSVSAEEPEDSNTLILYRDADIAIELTDLTIPAGAKKYIFTIKDNLDSGDDQAVLQASYAIDGSEVETNTLVYINSAVPPALTNPVTFTLTETNITIDLTAEAAALLPRYERGYLNWDLKLVTDAAVTIVLQGLAQIIGTSTRAIE